MASVTWYPTASTNGGTNTYSGWGAATSSSSEFVYTNLHTYIDDTTADDNSTWISTRADSGNTGNGTATFTMSGTALASNAKVTSVAVTIRFDISNPTTIASGGTLYVDILNSNSSVISTQSIDVSGKSE